MSDHFYSKTKATATDRGDHTVVVGTSTAGSTTIEVRVPDGVAGLTRKDVYDILEHIADYIVARPEITHLVI